MSNRSGIKIQLRVKVDRPITIDNKSLYVYTWKKDYFVPLNRTGSHVTIYIEEFAYMAYKIVSKRCS